MQRPSTAQLMPRMWELPEIAGPKSDSIPAFTLRHSITVTDYTVHVWKTTAVAPSLSRSVRQDGKDRPPGKWIACSRLPKLPLTGLARKILRKANLIRAQARPGREITLASEPSPSPSLLIE